MNVAARKRLRIPARFRPPIVDRKENGVKAFHSYDWYFDWQGDLYQMMRKASLAIKPSP